ncbi:MAG: hypothetical protein HON53_22155 [Planctomycetaceae bacterium]|jgi:hypothetical protein|nr:hypothetical protein [Planctomycetaceae bacterium]MBT6155408.1 hypothetical protein [Planctomycetaceae bacterium]MBT6487598.1 hypothetical protein [Planctomycetaceae bacterium]MBT6493410.1 hypothetical protein [Planctomycetaceae bacterium]
MVHSRGMSVKRAEERVEVCYTVIPAQAGIQTDQDTFDQFVQRATRNSNYVSPFRRPLDSRLRGNDGW